MAQPLTTLLLLLVATMTEAQTLNQFCTETEFEVRFDYDYVVVPPLPEVQAGADAVFGGGFDDGGLFPPAPSITPPPKPLFGDWYVLPYRFSFDDHFIGSQYGHINVTGPAYGISTEVAYSETQFALFTSNTSDPTINPSIGLKITSDMPFRLDTFRGISVENYNYFSAEGLHTYTQHDVSGANDPSHDLETTLVQWALATDPSFTTRTTPLFKYTELTHPEDWQNLYRITLQEPTPNKYCDRYGLCGSPVLGVVLCIAR